MVVVELRFPSGRYHATPWGAHVNEGLVEYPPSPWRLLRSLVAVWHRKLRPPDREAAAAEERTLERLLASLARGLPRYRLPPAVPAHTRHYMPLLGAKTTKVLDAFLDLGRDAALAVAWPDAELDPEAAALLARLAEALGFLGRAESWVAASADPARDLESETWNAVALGPGNTVPPGHEVIRLLAPLPPEELDAWRAAELDRKTGEALARERAKAEARGRTVEKIKMPAKMKAQIEASLPRTVTEALEVETGPMRKNGWNRPPGSRWVEYTRPGELVSTSPAAAAPRKAARCEVRPTVARFVVASQAPPRLTEAVSVAERIRMTLQKWTDGAPVFSGKAADGRPLEGHRHAFILCEAHRGHGRISHVTLHAPMGFDAAAQEALGRLLKVWGHGGHDLQLVLTGIGNPEDFAGLDVKAGQCPLLGKARVWISHTPFVPTRHPKTKLDERGLVIGSPEHDLRRLLAEHLADRFIEPLRVDRIDETRLGGRPTRWSAFRTLRVRGGGRRSTATGYGFRVEFPEPVEGPIAVGYGAHFGLGTFTPPEQEDARSWSKAPV